MPQYRQMGSIPPKRHTAHPHVPGHGGEGIYYEEVITTQVFSRAYSIAYHLRPPTRVSKSRTWVCILSSRFTYRCAMCTRNRFKMPRQGDPITGRTPLMFNSET